MKGWILVFSLSSVCVIPWFSGNNVLVQAAAVRFPQTQTAPSNHDQEASADAPSGQTMEHLVKMIGTGPRIVHGVVHSSDTFDHHTDARSNTDEEASVDAYDGYDTYDDGSFDTASYDAYVDGPLSNYRFKRAVDSGTGPDTSTTTPSPDQARALNSQKLPRPFNLNPPPPPDPQLFQPTFFGLGSNSNNGMLNRPPPGSSGMSGTPPAAQNPPNTQTSGQNPTMNQFGQQPNTQQPKQPTMPQTAQQSTMQQTAQQPTMPQPSQQSSMPQTGQPTMPQPSQQPTMQQAAQQLATQQTGQQMSPVMQKGPKTPADRAPVPRQAQPPPETRPPSPNLLQQMSPPAPGTQTAPTRREIDPNMQTPTDTPNPTQQQNPPPPPPPQQQPTPLLMPATTQGFQQTMPSGAMNPFGGMMPFGMNQPFFGSPFGMSPFFGFPPTSPFNMFSFVPGRGGVFLTNTPDMQPMQPMQMPPPAQPITSQMGGGSPRIFARDTSTKNDKMATSTTPNPLGTSTTPSTSTTTPFHFNFDQVGRASSKTAESNVPTGSGTAPASAPTPPPSHAPQHQFQPQPQFAPNFQDQNPFQMNPFFNPFAFPNFAQFALPPGGGNPMLFPDPQFMGPFQAPPNVGQPPFNMPPFPTQQFSNQFPPQANFRGQAPFQTRSTNQTAPPLPKDQTTTTPKPTTPLSSPTTKEKL